MANITHVHARQVLDSRGNPTVEVELSSDQHKAMAIVPSGASTGKYEAVELRDNDMTLYRGKGVLNAVMNVNNEIKDKIMGMGLDQQRELEESLIQLDGTENKSRLGANGE